MDLGYGGAERQQNPLGHGRQGGHGSTKLLMQPDWVLLGGEAGPALPSPWFDFHLPAVVLAAGSWLLFCCWRCCLMESSALCLRWLLMSSEATSTTMDMVMERLLLFGTHRSPLLLPMLM